MWCFYSDTLTVNCGSSKLTLSGSIGRPRQTERRYIFMLTMAAASAATITIPSRRDRGDADVEDHLLRQELVYGAEREGGYRFRGRISI